MLLERFTELYHRVHNSIDCQYMDQRSFRVRDQTIKGNANILLKAKNVNERRFRYLSVQEKVQKYDDTLEIENYIWSHVCQTLCHCQSVMISVVTSRFWRQRHDFGGNVINVDVNFDGQLRHSALMEFRAVSTWYDHKYLYPLELALLVVSLVLHLIKIIYFSNKKILLD